MATMLVSVNLEEGIIEKLREYANARGLTECEALKVIIGNAVKDVLVFQQCYSVPVPVSQSQEKTLNVIANIAASTGFFKCKKCSMPMTGAELLRGAGTCFACEPEATDDIPF